MSREAQPDSRILVLAYHLLWPPFKSIQLGRRNAKTSGQLGTGTCGKEAWGCPARTFGVALCVALTEIGALWGEEGQAEGLL